LDTQERLDQLIQSLNLGAWPYFLLKRSAASLRPDEINAVRIAVKSGRERAIQIGRAYPGKKSLDILRDLKVEVEILDENPQWGSRMQCAEYQHRPPRVTIYRIAMEKLASYAEQNQLDAFRNPATMLEVSLAHELYHHLERTHFSRISRHVQLPRWKVGPVTFYRQEHLLDEIAAQAFSQQFLGLTHNPAVLNLLLQHRSTEARSQLLEAAEYVIREWELD
jgi:hypothetical protein